MQDPFAEQLFEETAGILSAGYIMIMGEYNPVKV